MMEGEKEGKKMEEEKEGEKMEKRKRLGFYVEVKNFDFTWLLEI